MLGVEKGAGGGACQLNTGNGGDVVAGINSNVPAGGTATLTSFPNFKIPVSASLEADVDGDGFGDESQDSCPRDPTIHSGPCVADVSLAQRAIPGSALVGSYAVLSVTARNRSTNNPAHDVVVTERIAAGVGFFAGIGPNGPCTTTGGATVTCTVGDVPIGASVPVEIVVKVRRAGSASVLGRVSSQLDNVPANDSVTTTITGTAALSYCTVPRLVGLTTTAARTKLAKTGCKLGKATFRGKRRPGAKTVITAQYVPARIRVARGTKIAVTTRAKPKPEKHK